MACNQWMSVYGFNPTNVLTKTLADLQSTLVNDGVNCVNGNQTMCSTFCQSVTKNPSQCFACLSNPQTCPASKNRTQVGFVDCNAHPTDPRCDPCCPNAGAAVACQACIAAAGQGVSLQTFADCYYPSGISNTNLIIIVVCSVVGAIVVCLVIGIVVNLKRKAAAKDKLVAQLSKSGTNQQVLQEVEQLDYSKIDPGIFSEVNRQLALNRGGGN